MKLFQSNRSNAGQFRAYPLVVLFFMAGAVAGQAGAKTLNTPSGKFMTDAHDAMLLPLNHEHKFAQEIMRLDLANRDLSDYMMKILTDRGASFTSEDGIPH